MLEVAQLDRAPGCGPGGWRFESVPSAHGTLAQLVVLQTENLPVPGSIPGGSASCLRSSKLEQRFHKAQVAGSNPAGGTFCQQQGLFPGDLFVPLVLYSDSAEIYPGE